MKKTSQPVLTAVLAQKRLEYLRGELRAERISYGELAELASLKAYIEPGDVELLEAAGVPENKQPKLRWKGTLNKAETAEFKALQAVGIAMDSKQLHRFRNLRSRHSAEQEAKLPAYVICRHGEVEQPCPVREFPGGTQTKTQDIVEIEEGVFLDQEAADKRCAVLNAEAAEDPTEAESSTGEPRYEVKPIKRIS